MTLTFLWAQSQVDERINQHPDWYFPNKKLIEKLKEEWWEIEEALTLYEQAPTEENTKALKIEIGDELFALICLANSKWLSLNECFDLMMEKNIKRAKNNYKKEDK